MFRVWEIMLSIIQYLKKDQYGFMDSEYDKLNDSVTYDSTIVDLSVHFLYHEMSDSGLKRNEDNFCQEFTEQSVLVILTQFEITSLLNVVSDPRSPRRTM
jgi:hypothetical protein